MPIPVYTDNCNDLFPVGGATDPVDPQSHRSSPDSGTHGPVSIAPIGRGEPALIPRKHGISAARHYCRSIDFAVLRATLMVPAAANDGISAIGDSANSPEFEAYAWYCENDRP